MRISDWSSDVCSSDLLVNCAGIAPAERIVGRNGPMPLESFRRVIDINLIGRSEERRVGKECVSSVDLGGRRIIKKKIKLKVNNHDRSQYTIKYIKCETRMHH